MDPGLIPDVALVAVALGVVTGLTKLATGWYAAGRVPTGTRARVRTGSALVARGEFSIVIAELGVTREPDLGALAATYVVFLAVVGAILYQFADHLVPGPEAAAA